MDRNLMDNIVAAIVEKVHDTVLSCDYDEAVQIEILNRLRQFLDHELGVLG